MNETVEYQEAIKQEIEHLENIYTGIRIRILSDLKKYGMDLGKIESYCIQKTEIDALEKN